MSPALPVIELHGGPRDGLRIIWQEPDCDIEDYPILHDTGVPVSVVYNYVYREPRRLSVPNKVNPDEMAASHCFSPNKCVPSIGGRLSIRLRGLCRAAFSAVRAWLLKPVSFPMDLRAYQGQPPLGRDN
ncbi:MAG: hypothetical protein SFX18_10235 [Pirellulales bacterium]|nr:hypothetical protein [Pirellulales bacterium]